MGLWSEAIDQARSLLKESLAAQTVELETQRAELAVRSSEHERARHEFARERAAIEKTVAMAQEQLIQANGRHQTDAARVTKLQSECGRLVEQNEALRAQAVTAAARLEQVRVEHQEALRAVQERAEATENHWIKQVDEVRQALTETRKRAEALDRQRVAEIARLSGELQASIETGAQLRTDANEALSSARADISRLTETARLQQARAEEAERRLGEHTANALTREQFEQRLREVLSKTIQTATPARKTRGRTPAKDAD
jgi:chromosome segregation ATPase